MKKDIHPPYYPHALITCACGNTFKVGSTLPSYEVEICSACHPFYTGKGKIIDTAGRVERFKKHMAQKKLDGGRKKVRVKKPRLADEMIITVPALAKDRKVLVKREVKKKK